MQKLIPFLIYGSLCLGAAAAAGTIAPAAPVAKEAAIASLAPAQAAAKVETDFQAYTSRLSQRVEIEAALAQGRRPVPLLREAPPPYVPPTEAKTAAAALGPNQVIAGDPAMVAASPAGRVAKSKIEQDGYRAVRMVERSADGKWRALAMRGGTEVAIVVDEQGHVSSQ